MKNLKLDSLFDELPLYLELPIINTDSSDWDVYDLLMDLFKETNLKADLYCIKCKKERIFNLTRNDFEFKFDSPFYRGSDEYQRNKDEFLQDPLGYTLHTADKTNFLLEFTCTYDNNHRYLISLSIVDGNLIKTGQYPSIANLEKHDIDKYKKLLKDDYSNLNRAIGLHSHGIGVGSYVYLRRIFENLIEEKHIECAKESTWDEETYAKSRMADKIKMLERKLPELFKTAPAIYGILSKGVHELSEEECREYFPVMKSAIELILDDKLAELEANTKKNDLLKNISSIASIIK